MAETMGWLIDKICVAELKIYHIQEQIDRKDLSEDLRQLSRDRLTVMTRQRDDLVAELNSFADAWSKGAWHPKVYRQFKLYNDPRFAPRQAPSPGERGKVRERSLVPKFLIRLRVPLGFLFAAWYLVVARPSSFVAYLSCLILVALGCLLRSWAAGYLLKGKRVAVGGPYAFIRNPLYMGSFTIGIGFCAALWRWPLPWTFMVIGLTFFLGFGIVYRAKTLAEEKELAANLGDPYRDYARQVPAFLPTRGLVAGLGIQRFSWELYKRNREYECLLGSAVILLFLYWRSRFGI